MGLEQLAAPDAGSASTKSGVGAGLAGAFLSGLGSMGAAAIQGKQARKTAEYVNQMNIENWHMQNAYNSYVAQVQRMQDAGLNTRLMYGAGKGVGNAGDIPAVPMDPPAYENPVPGMLGAYSEVRNIQVQRHNQAMEVNRLKTDNLMAQAKIADIASKMVLDADKHIENMHNLTESEKESRRKELRWEYEKFMQDEHRSISGLQSQLLQYQVEGMKINNERQQADLDFLRQTRPWELKEWQWRADEHKLNMQKGALDLLTDQANLDHIMKMNPYLENQEYWKSEKATWTHGGIGVKDYALGLGHIVRDNLNKVGRWLGKNIKEGAFRLGRFDALRRY